MAACQSSLGLDSLTEPRPQGSFHGPAGPPIMKTLLLARGSAFPTLARGSVGEPSRDRQGVPPRLPLAHRSSSASWRSRFGFFVSWAAERTTELHLISYPP